MQQFLMLASFFLMSKYTSAVPLAEFYPYGSGAKDEVLPRMLDGSSSPLILPDPFIFFGRSYQTIFVSCSFLSI